MTAAASEDTDNISLRQILSLFVEVHSSLSRVSSATVVSWRSIGVDDGSCGLRESV